MVGGCNRVIVADEGGAPVDEAQRQIGFAGAARAHDEHTPPANGDAGGVDGLAWRFVRCLVVVAHSCTAFIIIARLPGCARVPTACHLATWISLMAASPHHAPA